MGQYGMEGRKEWLERLKGELPRICREREVAVVYLFGSQAEGAADSFSDVDIGVVFFDPPGNSDWWERWHRISEELEPLVAPCELDVVLLHRAPLMLQWQATSKGKVLYCAHEELRLKFEEKVVGEWLDFSEWLDGFFREMGEEIAEGGQTMLDRKLLLTHLSFVQQAQKRLEQLAHLSEEEFLANEDNIDVAQNRLRIALEAAADVGRHIVARLGWGPPTSYVDVFNRLATHGALSQVVARRMAELARFRNILVHRYSIFTPEEVHKRVKEHLRSIGDFLREIVGFLRSQGVLENETSEEGLFRVQNHS